MKKIRKVFTSWLILVMSIIIIQSCVKEPPLPQCEIDNVGTVTVKNSTGYNVWVDVTWGSYATNYEKLLYDNSSYKYSNVPAGNIECWATLDNVNWYYEYENLSVCEDMTYTWYLTNKKSANDCPFVIDIGDGNLYVPIKKEKI